MAAVSVFVHIKGSGPAMAVPIYTSAITQFALKCGGADVQSTSAETIIWNPKHKNHKDKNKASTSLDDEDSSMSQNGNLENENPNATVNSEINIPVVRRRSRNPPELQEASNEMKGPFHL
ncbi:hypothetical protein EVAR_30824_1 [Eumeta japonica]|uniref:Uncharacterized protein n=1 Tax=Eumeta variegata TaxID=151549 RepID=A0A4C1SJF4_EUMVA|nr:hypothetical protein EVAR_30824_1 [Eumeta japonica]